MRDVALERGPALCLACVSSGAVRVNLDGCLSSASAVNCRGNDSILVYQGPEPSAQERGLQPFTGNVGGSSHMSPPSPLLCCLLPASPSPYLRGLTLYSFNLFFPWKSTCTA